MKRICILWKRWGPYHLARLRAAAAHDAASEVVGLQTATFDSVYQWAQIQVPPNLSFRTIFPQRRYDDLRRDEIRKGVCRVLDDLCPDAIAIYGYVTPEAYAALSWARSNERTAIVMSDSNRFDAPQRLWLKEWLKTLLIRQFDAAICAGTSSGNYLAELGLPRERIFAAYDVVDNEYFGENAERLKSETLKEETRRKHGLPEKFFLASARFVEKKNLPRLMEAYARYRAQSAKREAESGERQSSDDIRSAPWDLVLLGDGPLRQTLTALRSTLGLDACVHLPGFKQYDELPVYYGLASAFVHAPVVEQWGLVVNEAMASGLPVLVSNRCGCAPDLVQNGVNGFIFDPYNAEELAKRMLEISAFQVSKLSGFGSASREMISQCSPDTFARSVHRAAGLGVWRTRSCRYLGRAALEASLRAA